MSQTVWETGTVEIVGFFTPFHSNNCCQTVSDRTKTDFEWDIQYPFLEHPLFNINSSRFSWENCYWTLGLNEDYRGDLNIRLILQNGNLKIAKHVKARIGIANKNGDVLFEKIFGTMNSMDLRDNVRLHIDKRDFQTSKFYKKDGNFTIFFAVETWTLKETKSRFSSSKITSGIGHTELFRAQFEKLFKNKTLSDLELHVGWRRFCAHKIALAARSEVFAAMFEHETSENLSNQIFIQDIDPDVFHGVLRYMYSGRMSSATMEKMAVGILAVADKYLLDQLKAECEAHLMNSMSADNCVELLALATQPHPAMHLKKYAIDFLRRFPLRVMNTDGWKKAKEDKLLWSCELIEMLCSPNCQMSSVLSDMNVLTDVSGMENKRKLTGKRPYPYL